MGAQLAVREVGFARRQNHPLKKLLANLTKESEDAVEVILSIMNDDKVDQKTRLAAASKLLDLQRQVAQDINQDELQRLIANVKFGGPKELETEDDTPAIDFSVVQDV
jgi:hypothetical protein